jgi:putative tryptophan/tyrosine transport system substrate-binding protein
MPVNIGRRELIVALGSAAAWPLAARAQRSRDLPTVGFIIPGTPSSHGQLAAVFAQRLRELGWTEGTTVTIERRWTEGRSERVAALAAGFVRIKADVIVTGGTANVAAVKQATSTIPVVFAAAGDPVANGFVASLARPGGNLTGLSLQQTDLGAKRLELFREMVPGLGRLTILANVANPITVPEMREVQATARSLSLHVVTVEIREPSDITPSITALKGSTDGIYVQADPLLSTHRVQINTLALSAQLPTMHGGREFVEAGGLMSYGPNFPDLYRRAADYVDKVLRGTKPGDIPVEQPIKFDLVVNLTTARALGLTVPATLLTIADEVIE